MPGSITNYLENSFLTHLFNSAWTPPVTVYLGIGVTVDDNGLTGEPAAVDGYVRKAISFNAAASRQVVQTGDIVFGPVVNTAWGTLGKWGVFDAETGGNCMATGDFSAAKSCPVGRSPRVNSGEIIIQILAGVISTVWAHRLLDRAFRNITTGTGKPDTWVALCETMPVDSDTDISAKEPAGSNYGRVQVNPNGGAAPVWTIAAAGALEKQRPN